MPDDPIQPKSFWQRPEGKTGLIPLALAGAAVIYFWGQIVPFLLNAAENTLHLMLVIAGILAILFVAFDKDIRRFLFYLYKSLMRYITSAFVEIDPIGILKTYKKRLEEKLSEMDSALSEIRGEKQQLDRKMQTNKADYDHSMGLVATAKAKGDQRILGLEGKQAVRLQTRLDRQKAYLERMQFIIQVLTRYREVSADTITDMGRDIEDKELERQESRSYKKGMSAAFGILHGLPDEKEMYDMSLETLERQYSQQIGEVEHFMEITKDIISKANLDDSAATDQALAKLEEWRTSKTDAAMGKTSKSEIIDTATKKAAVTGLMHVQGKETEDAGGSDYKQMLS